MIIPIARWSYRNRETSECARRFDDRRRVGLKGKNQRPGCPEEVIRKFLEKTK